MAFGIPVWLTSIEGEPGTATLSASLRSFETVALLGPSGVGKSTLLNALADAELAETGEVRSTDRKGRHTTTRRQLFALPGGALLLDTPGMRELQVWDLQDGIQQTFPDIDELTAQCRFRDCTHMAEPGCAVLDAVEMGTLAQSRLDSFRKLEAEAAYQARKSDPLEREKEISEYEAAMKSLKQLHPKYRERRR